MSAARIGFVVVMAVSFAYNFASSIASYTMPLMLYRGGYGPFWVGVCSLVLNLSFVLVSSVSGRFSDEWGRRRPFVVCGCLALSVGSIAMSTGTLGWLLAAATSLGVAGGLLAPNLTALAVDYGPLLGYEKPEKPIARLGLSGSLGWCLGLLAAGLAGSTSLAALLVIASSLACLLVSLLVRDAPLSLERALVARPRPRPHLGIVERVKLVYALITNPPRLPRGVARVFLEYLMSLVLLFIASSMFFTQLPVYMAHLGLSDREVYLLMSVHTLTSTFFYLTVPRMALAIGSWRLLELAVAARALAFLAPTIAPPKTHLPAILTLIATGVTWALISTTMSAIAVELARPGWEGDALGKVNTAVGLGLTLGGMLGGLVAEYSMPLVYPVASLLAWASLALLHLAYTLCTRTRGCRSYSSPSSGMV